MPRKVGVKPGQISGKITRVDKQSTARVPLTKLEKQARREARNQSIRVAAYYGDMGNASAMAINQADQNFYSPQLSTDFLELPQSEREKRELFRFWYTTHPIIGAAIDFHTDVPMSKIRLAAPKGKDVARNKQILHFFERMCRRLRLFQVLYDVTHEYWLHGNVFIFCEDHDLSSEIPNFETSRDDLNGNEEVEAYTDESKHLDTIRKEKSKFIQKFVEERYQGWQRLQILPPEQVKLEIFQYTSRVQMELIPSEKDRLVVMKAQEQGDADAKKIADDIPEQIRDNLMNGQPIPLNTTPYDDFLCSSFCYHLAHKRSPYDDRGVSILERCHLPGTEVTTRRDGQMLQIPIEELNPETDEVLGGSGEWRKFDHGTRPVAEDVCWLDVYKLNNPIGMTKDHRLPVLRNGEIVELEAGEIRSGDYVGIAKINFSESLSRVDLKQFVTGLGELSYVGRKSGNYSSMLLRIIDETENTITVQYSKQMTNPVDMDFYARVQRAIDWASNLTEDFIVSGPDWCRQFEFHSSDICRVREIMAQHGVSSDVKSIGFRNMTVFHPMTKHAVVDTSDNIVRTRNRYLELDGFLGYLIGYFLGDGCVARNVSTADGKFEICYSINSDRSKASSAHIKSILDNLGIKWSENHNGDMRHISIYDDILTRWTAANFGHTKEDKHLPDWVSDAPKSFVFGLLRGFIDSDGCVTVKNTGVVTIQLAMSMKSLVDQLQILMMSLGLPVSRHLHKSRNVRKATEMMKYGCKPLHQLVVSDRDAIRSVFESGFMAKVYNLEHRSHEGWGAKHKTHDGQLFYKVRDVVTEFYDGPVYSLNVDTDHSFYGNAVLLNNCLRTLLYQDKLRQAQTSIASRAMTPKRIIWGEKMSQPDVDDLRDQIDQALVDPDFTIITNFEIHWDEVGSRDRLLDLSTEYEITNKLLFIGLRMTESMLTGESTYSGERIHIDVMNTMYLLYRETLAEFVEQYLFAPVAEKKGFWEEDEYGNRNLLYPSLQFTRLALRDNTEMQDFMFNLYQKGSMPIDYIYELLNIDSEDAHLLLQRDMFTPKDSVFNEAIRSMYSRIGEEMATRTNALQKIAGNVGLEVTEEEGDRFGKE